MRIGAVFPQTEIGDDPTVIADFAQAVEGMGFDHLLVGEHVLGADPADRDPPWTSVFTKDSAFHEPFVLFGYLAGLTASLELVTGVLILPQRQTALVAKQAAEVDILSGGRRLRLGVGIGWNYVEYEALGQDFATRGRRQEEQVRLLRDLWREETLSLSGEWDRIDRAGLNPRPGREIPIWFGGSSDRLLERAGRTGDGWIATGGVRAEQAGPIVDKLHASAQAAGRDPRSFGIEAWASAQDDPKRWAADAERWERGATHISMTTTSAGFRSVDEHLEALRRFKAALG